MLSQLPRGVDLRILDVGTGTTAFGALLRDCNYQVDCLENRDYWRGRLPINPHGLLIDGDIAKAAPGEGTYDAVCCISVLEHIPDCASAVRNMMAALKPGGLLILMFPYCNDSPVPDSHRHPDSNRFGRPARFIVNVFSRADVDEWCGNTSAEIADITVSQFWSGRFWNSGEVLEEPILGVDIGAAHDHGCVVSRKPSGSEGS